MNVLIIIFCIWGASALIRSTREKRAREKAQRIDYEQTRIKREMREMKQRANEEVAARIALEREQMRQAKEQTRQAEILDKHEKRIVNLENKVRKLERDIESQKALIGDYYGQLDWLLLQQSGTTPGGKEFSKWQDKIVVKSNQLRRAENKLEDMKDARRTAQRELAA